MYSTIILSNIFLFSIHMMPMDTDSNSFEGVPTTSQIIEAAKKEIQESENGGIVSTVYIVTVDPDADLDRVINDMKKSTGGEILHVYDSIHGFAIEIPPEMTEANLFNFDSVIDVEADVIIRPLDSDVGSDDSNQSASINSTAGASASQLLPKGINRVESDISDTAKIDGVDNPFNVNIAIIDTGVDGNHPDLNVVYSKGFIKGNSNGVDDHGHGTHVAGTASARDNGIGVVGVAPGARIYSLKVLNSSAWGYLSDVISAVDWVAKESKTTYSSTSQSSAKKNYDKYMKKYYSYMKKSNSYLSKVKQYKDRAKGYKKHAEKNKWGLDRNADKNYKKYMKNYSKYMKKHASYLKKSNSYLSRVQQYKDRAEGYKKHAEENKWGLDSNADKNYKKYMRNYSKYMKKHASYLKKSNSYLSKVQQYKDRAEGYKRQAEQYLGSSDSKAKKNYDKYMKKYDSYMKKSNSYLSKVNSYKDRAEGYKNQAEQYKTQAEQIKANPQLVITKTYKSDMKKYESYMKKSNSYLSKVKQYKDRAESYKRQAEQYLEGLEQTAAKNSKKIDVVNMSIGASGVNRSLHRAIQACVAQGVVFVVSAGNDRADIYGKDRVPYTSDDTIPAAYPEVVTVSAMADTDGQSGGHGPLGPWGITDDRMAGFSNFSANESAGSPVTSPGRGIDVAAPGVSIFSTWKGGGYRTLHGTSMAAPHVAGAFALLIAKLGQDVNADGKIDGNDVAILRNLVLETAQPQSEWGASVTHDRDAFHEGVLQVSSF